MPSTTRTPPQLVRDGKLIAAAEEKRFRRIEHWAGVPSQAVAYCLREAGVQLSQVDHIAFNQDSRANLLRKIAYFLIKRPNTNLVLNRLRSRRARAGIPELLAEAFPGQIVRAQLQMFRWCSIHRSTKVSPWFATRRKAWTVFRGQKWICWSSRILSFREYRNLR
jgi:carbamoyltransferase